MERLYAPWRSKYANNSGVDSKNDCPFCIIFNQNNKSNQEIDKENFILKRTQHCVIMLNLYPYNAGHIMILPKIHKAHLYELDSETKLDLIESLSFTTKALEVLNPDGLNIGTNQGQFSGGSIPEHLHFHVLPRWSGDTGFLATLSNTKQISFDLTEIYKKLLPSFK